MSQKGGRLDSSNEVCLSDDTSRSVTSSNLMTTLTTKTPSDTTDDPKTKTKTKTKTPSPSNNHAAQPLPTENDDSDIVEHDVKVCDICGDAGREDMLAICSKCSDGAEHTYCMRKMLRKVPGSDWMCEECKFAEEQLIAQKQATETKRLTKSGGSSSQFPTKRVSENVEVGPAAKRQALEASIGSPRSSSPVKAASLSRESSFKNSDKVFPVERLRPPQHVRSTNDIHETAHTPVPAPRLQTNKGSLFKSKSFNVSNSKPKVKLVDEVVPQKQKGGSKDHASVDPTKERSKFIQKSMSFKSANLGRTNASDSKPKMFAPRISHTLDSKGPRSMKERNAFDKKQLSKLDRPPNSSTSSSTVSTPKAEPTPRGESGLLSFSGNSRDVRALNEGKSSTSKATGNLARRPIEVPITSVGVSSTTEQKSKDDPSFTTEKPSSSVDGTSADGFPRSQETTYQAEKTKETTSLRSRSTVMSNSRSTFCQKCKEIGHSAEFCPSGSSEASGIDASVSSARTCKEESARGGSKLKEAIHAALLRKPEIQRKKRTLDQVDEIATPSTDFNSELASQNQANKSKTVLSGEVAHEVQQAVLRNSTSDSSHADVKSCIVKPAAKDFPNHSLATSSQLVKMLAIPEYDYIWRGGFEVNGRGSLLEFCGGIQAHLSTCVSPRVPEEVRKFPQKLSLIEVPRSSTWPKQFCDGGAKEDNIALYFFAKDLESYEKNYKSLLDGMIKNDLALKGTFEGVELLIFPSNQLPASSQRWNMLFFLWGVFRAKRVNSSDSSNKSNIPTNGRVVPSAKKASNDVTAMLENTCSPKLTDAESSGYDRSCSKISEGCNEQKPCEVIGSGSALKDSSVVRDSDSNDGVVSDKMRSAGSSTSAREKSPSNPSLPVVELNPSSSSLKEEDTKIVCCEKKVLEAGVGRSGDEGGERKRPYIDLTVVDDVAEESDDIDSWRSNELPKAKDVRECVSEKMCIEECQEKVISEDLGSKAEMRFFPVDPRRSGGNSSEVWSGGEEQRGGFGFPNLELALGGAETKVVPQKKGMLPFLDEREDDSVPASLSLSLFPMAGPGKKEAQAAAAAAAASQGSNVSTSLLLFGRFPDK